MRKRSERPRRRTVKDVVVSDHIQGTKPGILGKIKKIRKRVGF